MSLALSAPGKTFVFGEYLALTGGPVLIATSEPRFKLKVRESQDRTANPFHVDSPAGRYWDKNSSDLSQFNFEFENPYGSGGFGGSTAEFLMLKSFHADKDAITNGSWIENDFRELLNSYWTCSTGQILPSGADLIAQATGGLCFFHREAGRIARIPWNLDPLKISLFKTQLKLKTHEHLATLKLGDLYSDLEEIAGGAYQSLTRALPEQFCNSVGAYRKALEDRGLVVPSISEMVHQFESIKGVRVAKGCGAMGLDTILVISDSRQLPESELAAAGEQMGLKWVAHCPSFAEGLRLESNMNYKEVQL